MPQTIDWSPVEIALDWLILPDFIQQVPPLYEVQVKWVQPEVDAHVWAQLEEVDFWLLKSLPLKSHAIAQVIPVDWSDCQFIWGFEPIDN